jgi:hypothetical protein
MRYVSLIFIVTIQVHGSLTSLVTIGYNDSLYSCVTITGKWFILTQCYYLRT